VRADQVQDFLLAGGEIAHGGRLDKTGWLREL
jgi:hypothetical protein